MLSDVLLGLRPISSKVYNPSRYFELNVFVRHCLITDKYKFFVMSGQGSPKNSQSFTGFFKYLWRKKYQNPFPAILRRKIKQKTVHTATKSRVVEALVTLPQKKPFFLRLPSGNSIQHTCKDYVTSKELYNFYK